MDMDFDPFPEAGTTQIRGSNTGGKREKEYDDATLGVTKGHL